MADITTNTSVNASAKKKLVGRPCKTQIVQRDAKQRVLGFQYRATGDGTLQQDKTLMLQPRPARVTPSALPAPPGVSTSGDGGETEVGAERPQRLPPTSSSSVVTGEQRKMLQRLPSRTSPISLEMRAVINELFISCDKKVSSLIITLKNQPIWKTQNLSRIKIYKILNSHKNKNQSKKPGVKVCQLVHYRHRP